jgi:hypothetical protein
MHVLDLCQWTHGNHGSIDSMLCKSVSTVLYTVPDNQSDLAHWLRVSLSSGQECKPIYTQADAY